jgi:hypothetical protein
MADTTNESSIVRRIRALLEESPPGPEDIVGVFRVVREHIPSFGPLAESDMVQLRGAAFVSPLFAQASINTVGASANVAQMIGRPAADLRRETEDAARWTAVEDEVKVTLKGVVAANLVRRHRIGLTALQTYHITRQLVRSKEHANLLPYVAEMKRLNRFGKKHAGRTEAAIPAGPPEPQEQ